MHQPFSIMALSKSHFALENVAAAARPDMVMIATSATANVSKHDARKTAPAPGSCGGQCEE